MKQLLKVSILIMAFAGCKKGSLEIPPPPMVVPTTEWTAVSSPFSGSLYCMEPVSDSVAFIGCSTKLLMTSDSGGTWQVVNDFSSPPGLISIANEISATASALFIASNAGKMGKTVNGTSITTVNVNAQNQYSLYALTFSTSALGLTAGFNGIASTTSDGGTTWNQVSTGTFSNIYDVCFRPTFSNTFFLVGENGVIRRSTNSGQTWSARTSNTSNDLYDIFFVDVSTAFIAGDGGTILRSADGGSTWSTLTTGTTAKLRSVCFSNAQHGYAAGDDVVLSTNNYGNTWTVDPVLTSLKIYDMCYWNNTFFMIGLSGAIYRN